MRMVLRRTGVLLTVALAAWVGSAESRIAPYAENPLYWQYDGAPVLLLGGSKTDHIFLLDDLEAHLDEVTAAGGNYVRCTMSQREGADLKPHLRDSDGRFDLSQWNPAYWARFERCLSLCRDRGIVVQIELWDRFDYSKEQWEGSPWRPANNVNYSPEEIGLADGYPEPAYRDLQPFFHVFPSSPLYDSRLDSLVAYQEAFVDKVLSISLPYGNVLYCVGNESSAPLAWSLHWGAFVLARAEAAGVSAFVTQMYDKCRLEPVIEHPDTFGYIEGSKILGPRRQAWAPNGEEQWDKILAVHGAVQRPINVVKIITNEDGQQARQSVQKFWRGLMAGMAAIRFHREPAGLGLTEPAVACIRSVRLMAQRVNFWDLKPDIACLRDRELDEAYARVQPGLAYIVYFPRGGAVGLDLGVETLAISGLWLDIEAGKWLPLGMAGIQGPVMELVSPIDGPSAVVILHTSQILLP